MFNNTFTLLDFKNLSKAFKTSLDLSEKGNTLLPLSTLVLSPYDSNSFITSSLVKEYKALYKKKYYL